MDFVTHHSRVFDGITQAKVRALVQPAESCVFATKGCQNHPAAVFWVHESGSLTPLCREHMDKWLEHGDPKGNDAGALVPMKRRRS